MLSRWLRLRRPLREVVVETYLTADPRSLGLGRIALASVLLIDLFRRLPLLRDFYSNEGLLPNHTVLWRPMWPKMFSVFFGASQVGEAGVLMLIAAACYVALLVGWRTRLFHVLSFAMATSLHNRVIFVENGAVGALGALMLWTAFLPLGRCFSIDAWLARRRVSPSGAVPLDAEARPVVSLAVLALLLQLVVIYAFNCVHKSGETWRDGSAVHYVLFQARIVTSFGVWFREHVPFSATEALTRGTLIVEGAAPLLLLSPVGTRWLRPVAFAALAALHLGIASVVNLGIFSVAMLAYYPFLLGRAPWDWFARRARGSAAERSAPTPSAEARPLLSVLRELGVAFALVVLAADVTVANAAVPRALRWENRPGWMVDLVLYPHLFQGWGMFAPDAPREDSMVYVDAVTVDGRHVDPLNEVASLEASLPLDALPARLGHSSFWCDYELQIGNNPNYWQALTEWIQRHPQRTGRPEDGIVAFSLWELRQDSPPPGQTRPTNVRRRELYQWGADGGGVPVAGLTRPD